MSPSSPTDNHFHTCPPNVFNNYQHGTLQPVRLLHAYPSCPRLARQAHQLTLRHTVDTTAGAHKPTIGEKISGTVNELGTSTPWSPIPSPHLRFYTALPIEYRADLQLARPPTTPPRSPRERRRRPVSRLRLVPPTLPPAPTVLTAPTTPTVPLVPPGA